jgi:hypothetical protein
MAPLADHYRDGINLLTVNWPLVSIIAGTHRSQNGHRSVGCCIGVQWHDYEPEGREIDRHAMRGWTLPIRGEGAYRQRSERDGH